MLRWIRGYYLKMLPLTLLAVAMLIGWEAHVWVFVVLGVFALLWLQSIVSLSIRIRREERR